MSNRNSGRQVWSKFSSLPIASFFWFHWLDTGLFRLTQWIFWTSVRAAWVRDQPMAIQVNSRVRIRDPTLRVINRVATPITPSQPLWVKTVLSLIRSDNKPWDMIGVHSFVRLKQTTIPGHLSVRLKQTTIPGHLFVRRKQTTIPGHLFVRRKQTTIPGHLFVRRKQTTIPGTVSWVPLDIKLHATLNNFLAFYPPTNMWY